MYDAIPDTYRPSCWCGHHERTKDLLRRHKGRDHRGPGGGYHPRLEPEELPKKVIDLRVLHTFAVGARPIIGIEALDIPLAQVEVEVEINEFKILYVKYD